MYDSQNNGDEGTMGEKYLIPNTSYVDNHIDQLYDSQKNGDEGTTGEKYLIPNYTLTIILTNCMTLRRMGTKAR